MVLAHHIILTGYGHWLPNDPRGSLSKDFRSDAIPSLGDIHYGRKSPQPPIEHVKTFRKQAGRKLKHPVLWFGVDETKILGDAFRRVVSTAKLTCYACGILRNHAHLVIRKHKLKGEGMIKLLKDESLKALQEMNLLPPTHPLWSQDDYFVFKDTPAAVRAAVGYIVKHFEKHRIPTQGWDFVVPYDNWPFHKR